MLARFRQFWQLLEGQRLRYAAAMVALVLVVITGYLVPLVGAPTIDFVFRSKGNEAADAEGPATDAAGHAQSEAAAQARNEPSKPDNPLHRAILSPMIRWMGGPETLRNNLWIPALVMAALAIASGVFMYLRNRWAAVAAESIARRLRDRLYGHLQNLPCSYFDTAETGDLVQRCTSDVETIRAFLANEVVSIGRSLVMLLAAAPILLLLNVRLALISMAVIPVILVYSMVFFLKARAAFKLQDEAEGHMTSCLQENLTGIRVVRAFARQEFECGKFAGRNAAYRDRGFHLAKIMARFYPTSDALCMTQMAIVLFSGGYFIQQGWISVGTFFAVSYMVGNLLWPVRQMGRTLAEAGKAMVSMDRHRAILGQREEESVPEVAGEPEVDFSGALVFDGLSFAHGEVPVLRDVSFRVEPGQTVAILGPSGSGKTTLVNLLLRFYDYRQGSIRIDGRELLSLDRKRVRSQIGVVMQEPFLYSRTLRENIRFGRSSAPDEQVESAASVAGIHSTIVGFEEGYGAMVGERGVRLSGGQRQRVALARAVVREPPILILDDALSAVDTRTESLILEALRRRHGRHSTLVIAHRLSTLMRADRIIVLEGGRVVQSGTHEELVGVEGLYRRLWRIQSSLEEDLQKDLAAAP